MSGLRIGGTDLSWDKVWAADCVRAEGPIIEHFLEIDRSGGPNMDYEYSYACRRAAEERKAASRASDARERDLHLTLARAFEEHLKRLQPSS